MLSTLPARPGRGMYPRRRTTRGTCARRRRGRWPRAGRPRGIPLPLDARPDWTGTISRRPSPPRHLDRLPCDARSCSTPRPLHQSCSTLCRGRMLPRALPLAPLDAARPPSARHPPGDRVVLDAEALCPTQRAFLVELQDARPVLKMSDADGPELARLVDAGGLSTRYCKTPGTAQRSRHRPRACARRRAGCLSSRRGLPAERRPTWRRTAA